MNSPLPQGIHVAYDLVIKNGLLVNEGNQQEGDLAISGDRIAKVGGTASGRTEIDADGGWVIPGMIDDQVHFRQPGFEHKGTIATESRAAIAGGITSYMEMPNCIPQTINQAELEKKHERAALDSHANYGFYLGATNENIEEIKAVDRHKACGVKVFMGASTGNMLVDDETALNNIFASCPILIATHCEDTPTIVENERLAIEKFDGNVPASEHPYIRSAEACFKSSSLAVELAKTHGSRLHVLHLTTAREMELFEVGPVSEKRITAEVCVHHLYFNESWYASKGSLIKCNPSIKRRADQLAVQQALKEDRIDVVATDHAPHTLEEKEASFMEAPAGLPLVQHAVVALMEGVKMGIIPLELAVKKSSHAPAELFQVKERGFLREGYFADVLVIDHDSPTVVDNEPIYAKCQWSPFGGVTFSTKISHTIVNGKMKFSNGLFRSNAIGMPLTYDR